MLYAAEHTNPDIILHLGDNVSDAQNLSRQLPNTIMYIVKGNCDYSDKGEIELLLTLDSKKVFMTHGHTYGVKSGLTMLIERARQLEADIVLYGHTHRAALNREHKLWLLNPGQMERHDKSLTASYGIVTIEDGSLECGIEVLPTNVNL